MLYNKQPLATKMYTFFSFLLNSNVRPSLGLYYYINSSTESKLREFKKFSGHTQTIYLCRIPMRNNEQMTETVPRPNGLEMRGVRGVRLHKFSMGCQSKKSQQGALFCIVPLIKKLKELRIALFKYFNVFPHGQKCPTPPSKHFSFFSTKNCPPR